jgi:hypothetical protein
MVPLREEVWAEVKTLAMETVSAPKPGKGVHVHVLSSCSRLTDVAGFKHAMLVELHRRGLEGTEQAAAVMEGADWLQVVIPSHRADAGCSPCRRVRERHWGSGSCGGLFCASLLA